MPELIKTINNHTFMIIEQSNQLAKSSNILYGTYIRLFCDFVLTEKNPKGTYHYPYYFIDKPFNICQMSDLIERRKPTELELSIFQDISSGKKLNSEQKSFLRDNFF